MIFFLGLESFKSTIEAVANGYCCFYCTLNDSTAEKIANFKLYFSCASKSLYELG